MAKTNMTRQRGWDHGGGSAFRHNLSGHREEPPDFIRLAEWQTAAITRACKVVTSEDIQGGHSFRIRASRS